MALKFLTGIDSGDHSLDASGGIHGLTLSNGISGSNFNITGVNQLSINDPGEGINFHGRHLYVIDDANDNIANWSGITEFRINGNALATQSWVNTNTLNQSEGDARYLRSGANGVLSGSLSILSGSQANHNFETSSSVATYRSDAPYWRLWQPESQEQIAAVNGGEVRLSYDGTTKIKTQSGGVDFLNGNLTSVNALIFNDNIRFLDAGNDSSLKLRFGDSNNGKLRFEKGDGTRVGEIYWDTNGNNFGVLNKDGQWALRTTATDTLLCYDGSTKFRTDSSGTVTEGRHHINGYVVSTSYGDFNGEVKGTLFRDRNNSSYYLDPAGTSNLTTVVANEYKQRGSGIPRNNLGDPTVTEMALFDSQFTCKTDLSNSYTDLTKLTFWVQQDEGGPWEEQVISEDQKKRFLRTNNSNVIIPNGAYKFRVEFNAKSYTFANAIYFYWSSNSHNSQVHIWKKRCSDGQWFQHTSSTNTVSSWPGHLYLPFSTIPWHETNTTSTGHFTHIRVEFTPNWSTGNYAHRDINLNGGQIWGGYPSGRRTPHSIDQNGRYIFPAALYADGSGTAENKLLKTSDILGTDITSHNWNDFISGNSQFSVRSATNASGSNMPSAYNYGLVISAHESNGGKLQIYGPHNGSEGGNGLWFRTGWGGDFDPWAEIWHSNNDGSGSGLDADLLDGQQGSHYLNYNNLTNKPSTFPPSSHNHDRLHEKGTIDFGASYLQWTDNSGTGGDGLNGNAPENPFNDWHHHLIQNHGNNGGYYVDIASSFHHDRIHFRRVTNGTKTSWNEFLHTGNFNPNDHPEMVGPQGPQGETGPQGPAGATGPQGPQGDIGEVGPEGPRGAEGGVGPQGPAGPTGPKGDTGDTGPQGPQGPAGSTGPQGPQGPAGSNGSNGADGGSINEVRLEGYELIVVGDVMGEVNLGNVRGATGAAGSDGAAGATGPQGPQGPAGPKGDRGDAGATGATGPAGPEGPEGPQGPQGLTGGTGPQGPAGPAGPAGPEGPEGPQGPQGPQGLTGGTGPQGPQGPAGADGNDGATGPQGPQGPAGSTGATGPQGPQGPQGPAGTNGTNGSMYPPSQYGFLGAQTYTSSNAKIRLNPEVIIEGGLTAMANDRITFTAAGTYMVSWNINWQSYYNNRSNFGATAKLNGTAIQGGTDVQYFRYNTYGHKNTTSTTFLVTVTANQYLEFFTFLHHGVANHRVTPTNGDTGAINIIRIV